MAAVQRAPKSFPLISSTRASDLAVTRRGSQCLIYKSVPAVKRCKTAFDLYVEQWTERALNSPRITMIGSQEFAKRFTSRLSTRAPVVHPESGDVQAKAERRGTVKSGFFPSVKVRGNSASHSSTARTVSCHPMMKYCL